MAARIVPGDGLDGTPGPWARSRDLRLSLPLEEATASKVRRAMREFLKVQQVAGDVAEDVVLATDEACVNAILHSRAAGRLRVRAHLVQGRLRIEVRDAGRGFAVDDVDPSRPADPLDLHGRGLFLMMRLMDDVRVTSHPEVGTVVEMYRRL